MAIETHTGPPALSRLQMDDPHQVYSQRLAQRQQTAGEREKELDRLGLLRLAVFAGAVVMVWLVFVSRVLTGWWLAVPVVVFIYLLIRYDRARRAMRRARRAARYYQFGLDRLEERWPGKGHTGDRYLDDKHLYALDLDVFGKGSLFERISTARTRPGEETLADWFCAPAAAQEILDRQEAIRELTPQIELREDLALLGAEVPPVDFSPLIGWGQSPVLLDSRSLRILLFFLALVNLAAVIGWLGFGTTALPMAATFLVAGSVALWLGKRVKQVLEPIEPMGRDLFLLAGILERMERESFADKLLAELQRELQVEGKPPSTQIKRLAGLVDWINSMKNQFFLPLGLVLLWRTQMAFAVEAWRKRSGPVIGSWLTAVGCIEALSSLAGYAYENPDDCFPEITTDTVCFDGEDLGHPLLPKDECVRNDVHLVPPVRVLLVSGSNMSGKSTLLRTVGTNAVLALAGAPVRARRLKLAPAAIGATLRIQDSLLAGRSRFFAEISRIRDILDRTKGDLPVLFLLDELFHGTNSHDRGIGAEALLCRLLSAGSIGLLTTHDLSLTHIAEQLGEQIRNVHFADDFIEGKMHFDYKMRPGVVPHSNALSLMRAIGLEV